MNRKALVLSCLLAQAVAASAQAPSAVLDLCDKKISEAETAVREIERCVAELPKAEAAARKDPVLDAGGNQRVLPATSTVMMDAAPSPLAADQVMEAKANPAHDRLIDYYMYTAYMKNDPKACKPLGQVPGARMEAECRKEAAELRLDAAWTAPAQDFINACAALGSGRGVGEECCGLVARSRSQPNCAALSKCFPSESYCRQFFAARNGDAAACASEQHGCGAPAACAAERARCQDWAAYSTASRARSSERCGASDRCRVLMGGGAQVVAARAAELQKSNLGRWFLGRGWERAYRKETIIVNPKPTPVTNRTPRAAAPPARVSVSLPGFVCQAPLHRPENRKVVADLSTATGACLDRVDGSISPVDLKMTQAVDSRREKIARLAARAHGMLDSAGAHKPADASKR